MASDTGNILNALLRGEISATETYQQALAKIEGDERAAELRQFHADHREAANALRLHVREKGEQPDKSSGAWGAFAKTVEGAATLFGNQAALKALKEGEEHGLKSYRDALDEPLPEDCRALIRSVLIPKTEAHIRVLDKLMSGTTTKTTTPHTRGRRTDRLRVGRPANREPTGVTGD